ncbi:MAG: ABC transporter permease, partial [Bowdeniella nasicola]|nr:ABC transporter permease [Bowdeniella nasicola]
MRVRELTCLGRLARAQMRTSWPRLIVAALSLVLATAFVTVAFLASALLRQAAIKVVSLDDGRANVIVQASGAGIDAASITAITDLPDVAQAAGDLTGSLRIVGEDSIDTHRFVPANNDPFARYTLIAGRPPSQPGEIAISTAHAARYQAPIGSQLTVQLPVVNSADVSPQDSALGGAYTNCDADDCTLQLRLSVVGQVASAPPLVGSYDRVVVSPADIDAWVDAGILAASADRILALAANPEAAIAEINEVFGPQLHAQTTAQAASYSLHFVTAQSQVVSTVVAIFAALSLLVAAMVVANTSSVLIHQRIRIIGQLRCIGAVGEQLRIIVLFEALITALVCGI